MQYHTSNNTCQCEGLFLHTLWVGSLVTTLMISLPFNSYLQGVKVTEGCFWIRGGISASSAQEHGMSSPLGASLAAIKCSVYLSQEGGKLKALSFHKAKKAKNKRWKSLAVLLWQFSHFSPLFSLCLHRKCSAEFRNLSRYLKSWVRNKSGRHLRFPCFVHWLFSLKKPQGKLRKVRRLMKVIFAMKC